MATTVQVRSVETWRRKAGEVGKLLQDGGGEHKKISESLGYLSSLMYPLEGLTTEVIEQLLRQFAQGPELSSECAVMLGRLVSNLITYQKVSLSAATQEGLLSMFLAALTTVQPPTELLYACAALAQAGTISCNTQDPELLLEASGTVVTMATSGPIEVQRAALNYVSTLCQVKEFNRIPTLQLLDQLLSALLSPTLEQDTLLQIKLVFSQLKCLHSLLSRSPLAQSSPHLPNLLAILRAAMMLGLPGQPHLLHNSVNFSSLLVVGPPRLVTAASPSPKQRPQTIAGPQPRRRQKRVKEQKGGKRESGWRSQDSSEEGSLSDHVKLRPSNSFGGRGSSWSGSESELSDSEPAPNQIKMVLGKIRHLAFSCLTAVFKSLDSHTKFSYGLTFLPDGPRPPNSPPSLMTCILKDPLPKCRGGAVSVLFTLLEGSKVYLAPADDRPRPSQSFTPYSVTLGNTVQELHRSLLLAMTTESQHNTLTQVIRALAQLVASCPYHQLSEGYIRRVTAALERYSTHRDTNVQVACLTCAGAVVSLAPPLPEVVNWLANEGASPWILEFCLSLLQAQNPLVLQTEALQVLTALPRFYFSQLGRSWVKIRDVCLSLLNRGKEGLQQHLLKVLEELGRTLSTLTPPPPEAVELWEQLLSGPLTSLLQAPSDHTILCSQSCSVLSTIGPYIMDDIKVSTRALALTLPLGLCRDETSTKSIVANAVRVLGVFVTYDTLRNDESFLIDCQSAILHCLSLPSLTVRVQASWALANYTDPLPPSPHHPALKHSLYVAVVNAVKDVDKVRCNGVRAAGNLLKELTQQDVAIVGPLVETLSSLVASSINSGSVKGRWNTCYACFSALSNTTFGQLCSSSVVEMTNQLCIAVQSSKNFKVRINAALALGVGVKYLLTEAAKFVSVWEAVLEALDSSDQQVDFSEYKHSNTLKSQLFTTLMFMLESLSPEQAELVKSKCLSPSLKEKLTQAVKTIHQASSETHTTEDKPLEIMRSAVANLTHLCETKDMSDTVVDQLLKLLSQAQTIYKMPSPSTTIAN